MAKQIHRKPPRRAPSRPVVIDDELAELAAIIAEQKLDNNAAGWLSLPWRSGWNMVRLCLSLDALFPAPTIGIEATINMRLREWLLDRSNIEIHATSKEIYWAASEYRERLASSRRGLACGLRALQVMLAKSDGGGEVYNDIVRGYIETLPAERVGDAMLDARCWDAIGCCAQLQNDRHDRLRRAFKIAWSKGLYRAAYAIPRAQ